MADRPNIITDMCLVFWIFLLISFIYNLFNLDGDLFLIIFFFANKFILLLLSIYLWNMKKIAVFLPIFSLIIQLIIFIIIFGNIFDNDILNYSLIGIFIFSSLGSSIIFLIIALISSKYWNEMDWGLVFWERYKGAYL